MTRKDYVAIAAAIRDADNVLRADALRADSPAHRRAALVQRDAVALVVDNLSATLAADNPAFDADRFAAACGVRS